MVDGDVLCQVVLHYQSLTEQAHVRRLISQLHRNTGQVVKKKPRYMNNVRCRCKLCCNNI